MPLIPASKQLSVVLFYDFDKLETQAKKLADDEVDPLHRTKWIIAQFPEGCHWLFDAASRGVPQASKKSKLSWIREVSVFLGWFLSITPVSSLTNDLLAE